MTRDSSEILLALRPSHYGGPFIPLRNSYHFVSTLSVGMAPAVPVFKNTSVVGPVLLSPLYLLAITWVARGVTALIIAESC